MYHEYVQRVFDFISKNRIISRKQRNNISYCSCKIHKLLFRICNVSLPRKSPNGDFLIRYFFLSPGTEFLAIKNFYGLGYIHENDIIPIWRIFMLVLRMQNTIANIVIHMSTFYYADVSPPQPFPRDKKKRVNRHRQGER